MLTYLHDNLSLHTYMHVVLQLYGTGNIPSVKKSFVQLLGDAVEKGIMVVAATQCFTGSGQ